MCFEFICVATKLMQSNQPQAKDRFKLDSNCLLIDFFSIWFQPSDLIVSTIRFESGPFISNYNRNRSTFSIWINFFNTNWLFWSFNRLFQLNNWPFQSLNRSFNQNRTNLDPNRNPQLDFLVRFRIRPKLTIEFGF